MSRPRFSPVTATVERDRSARVMAELRKVPAVELIRTATALMRIHPDLAGPFAAAALAGITDKEPRHDR